MRERRFRTLALLVASVLLPSERADAEPVMLGSEFRVNAYTTGLQAGPGVCAAGNSDFVVVWSEPGGGYQHPPDSRDGSAGGVFARRFDASGSPQAGDFQVNTYTTAGQFARDAVCFGDGSFVVAWSAYAYGYGPGSPGKSGGFAQVFDGSGQPVGSEFLVTDYADVSAQTATNVRSCRIGNGDFVVVWEAGGYGVKGVRLDSDGQPIGSSFALGPELRAYGPDCCGGDQGFVVAWHVHDAYGGSDQGNVFVRRYSAAGEPLGTPFLANTFTDSVQERPAIACAPDGGFVVVWQSGNTFTTQDGSFVGIFGQRFDGTGAGLGTEFQVNSYTTLGQYSPAVAWGAGGGFVVAWESNPYGGSASQEGDGGGVFARLFSASGQPLAGEFLVNGYTTSEQARPSVAAGANGDFVVTWRGGSYAAAQDGSSFGVFGRRFAGSGQPRGTDFQINTYTTGDQEHSDVAVLGDGGFVVSWQGPEAGYSRSAFVRSFDAAGNPKADERRASALTGEFQDGAAVTTAGSGFLATWEGYDPAGGVPRRAFARPFDADAAPTGFELVVSDVEYSNPEVPGTLRTCRNGADEFVVVWDVGTAVKGKRFDATGKQLGSSFRLGPAYGSGYAPACCNGDSGFVVVWGAYDRYGGYYGAGYDVRAQRFSPEATPDGTEFGVNTYTTGSQNLARVACKADGEFVVVWQSGRYNYPDTQDGAGAGAFGQRFGGAGQRVGTEFRVNTETGQNEQRPDVSIGASGEFLVVWESERFGGSVVHAQAFADSGAPLGTEFVVQSNFQNFNVAPAVASGAAGSFVVVWDSFQLGYDNDDVVGRRIGLAGATTTTVPAGGVCGDPVTPPAMSSAPGPASVNASDALFALQAAVGLRSCDLCVCDVNDSGGITATDALIILSAAVALPIPLTCPPCS